MATYRFELTFDFDNPGDVIFSDMAFGKEAQQQGYALGHTLYDAQGKVVAFDPTDRKSHRFKDGDQVYVRLFALNRQFANEALTPQELTFDLQSLSSQYLPQATSSPGQTPFVSQDGTPVVGTAAAQGSMKRTSMVWNQALSQTLAPTGSHVESPCWVLVSPPYSNSARPYLGTAQDDLGAPVAFRHFPQLGVNGSAASNIWRFQIWTVVENNAGARKVFIFDPEMIVDPNV